MAAPVANDPWDEVIGDRTADKMREETSAGFQKDKKSTNAWKRLQYINGLFNASGDQKSDESDENVDEKEKDEHFWKPVDSALDVTNPFAQLTKTEPCESAVDGVYAISAEAGVSTKCNFSVKDSGTWYYELEVTADPQSHDGFCVGFANPKWSERVEVGHDAHSYGLKCSNGRLYNVESKYGSTSWKGGDVLGVMLDFDESNCKLSFSLNGEDQGVAFEHIDCEDNLFAALTLGAGISGVFKYKEADVQHKPDGYSCVEMADDAKLDDMFEISGPLKLTEEDGQIKLNADEERTFPTAVLKGCPLTPGNKWYYEFVFDGDSDRILAQIGISNSKFSPSSDGGEGVGDDGNSWGVDFMRMRKWGSTGKPYATDSPIVMGLQKGHIVGCTLDLDKKVISYSVNGKDLGVAFENVSETDGLYPAVSIRNVKTRQAMIATYRDDSIKDKKYPEPVHYYTLCLAPNAMKYKPDGARSFTECTVFKAMAICDGLKEYSFAQYKSDYAFMDTVIMLQKDEDFDTILKSVDDDTLVVCDFWATWCGPCIYVAPLYHAISEEFKDVVFLKADVDKLSELSASQNIQAMPTFKFFKGGKEVHMVRGANAAAVKEAVEKYSKSDKAADAPADKSADE